MIPEIAKRYGFSPYLATLIANRVDNIEDVDSFLEPKLKDLIPDPYSFSEMEKAVTRIEKALANNEKIAVFGDYDVDGASSTALILRFFRDKDICVYIPNRETEGYGPNPNAIQYFHSLDINLIIMVDCGTSAIAEVDLANQLGMDVIIFDHHLPASTKPNAYALINPNCEENARDDLKGLCAAGVTFLVLIALRSRLQYNVNLIDLLDIVALATVCDVMPLIGLNRAFVKQGLIKAQKRPTLGIDYLSKLALCPTIQSSYHFGFVVGPRINAGGRIGDQTLGYKLLASDDRDEVTRYAKSLHTFNDQRRSIESNMLERAHAIVTEQNLMQKNIILLGDETFHPGIIGILAARIGEHYQKPALIMAMDQMTAQGSARSLDRIDIGWLLQKAHAEDILLKGGGHKAAGGFKLHRSRIEDFYDFLEKESADIMCEKKDTKPELILPISAFSKHLYLDIQRLEPFGPKNPEPLLGLDNVFITSVYVLKEKHVRCVIIDSLGQKLDAVCFNTTSLPENVRVNVHGNISMWNDRISMRITKVV